MKGNSRALLLYMWKGVWGNVSREELRSVLAQRQTNGKKVSDKAIENAIEYLGTKLSEAALRDTVIKKSGGLYYLRHPQKDGPQNFPKTAATLP